MGGEAGWAPGPDGEAQGLASPSASRAGAWAGGGSAPGTRGPLASSVGGRCLQPTVMPKVNEVSCVWMQNAVHTPVLTGGADH